MRVMRLFPLAPLLCACGPKTTYTDADVPKAQQIDDVMWAQAQAMDPQFKKAGRSSYTDEDWAGFTAGANRLKLTTAKLKESFSKGPEFNQFADALAARAAELGDAAAAKDAAKASAALTATKAACKACHSKFK